MAEQPPRYLLFTGYHYYPRGGALDFNQFGDDPDLLVEEGKKSSEDQGWWHVYDLWTQKLVAAYSSELDHVTKEEHPDCVLWYRKEVDEDLVWTVVKD